MDRIDFDKYLEDNIIELGDNAEVIFGLVNIQEATAQKAMLAELETRLVNGKSYDAENAKLKAEINA